MLAFNNLHGILRALVGMYKFILEDMDVVEFDLKTAMFLDNR